MRRAGSACWENGPRELAGKLSLQRRVTGDTVPAFLWCTQEDEAVPMENSLLFCRGLRSNGVPMELHIYEKGRHGLALCDLTTEREPSQVVGTTPDGSIWRCAGSGEGKIVKEIVKTVK